MIDILVIFLFLVIVVQNIIHHIERRDMYNRLMSKDLKEYKQSSTPPTNNIPSAHDRVLKNWKKKVGDK